MFPRKSFTTMATVAAILLAAGMASADAKIVKKTHRDAFQVMGKYQPAVDQEEVTWIGSDRMRLDQGDTTTIVRLDQEKLYIISHPDRTYQVVDLPLDVASMLPEGMGGMTDMMKLAVTVTPSDERKKVGDWDARRYDLVMTSQMMRIEMESWATTDVDVDYKAFYKMYAEIYGLQPGMADVGKEMQKIDGLIVEQTGNMVMTMMGGESATGTSENVTSVDTASPPAGTYDPPPDYTAKPFSYMEMLQQQR